MCLRRYLVAVGGMTLQQQRREQLDQAFSVEDTALLEQKGVLEPAIPQPTGTRGEPRAPGQGGGGSRSVPICHLVMSLCSYDFHLVSFSVFC